MIILSANTSWYLYNFRLSTIRRLINDGHQVTVIAPRDEYSHKLINLDLKFIELNFKKSIIKIHYLQFSFIEVPNNL